MIGSRGKPSRALRALLELERPIPVLSQSTRDRSLARARSALASSAWATIGGGAPISRKTPRILGWAAAVVSVCLASAAGSVAAYLACLHLAPIPASPAASAPVTDSRPRAAAIRKEQPEAPPLGAVWPRATTDGAAEELRLLEDAREAMARNDFARALAALAEHGRRFRHGQLNEEREALRVEALVGLGHHDEVRRVAAAFEVRFPRSPLLPIVTRMASSEP